MSAHPTDDPREAAVEAIRNRAPNRAVIGGMVVAPEEAVAAIEAAGLRVVWADPPEGADLVKRYGELRDQLTALVAEADALRAAFGAHRCDLRGDSGAPSEDPEAAEETVVARDGARGVGVEYLSLPSDVWTVLPGGEFEVFQHEGTPITIWWAGTLDEMVRHSAAPLMVRESRRPAAEVGVVPPVPDEG